MRIEGLISGGDCKDPIETLNAEERDIYERMAKAGMKPVIHDMCVPHYENMIRAGLPTELGDIDRSKYVVIPRHMLGLRPVVSGCVMGDSMKDMGMFDGDRIEIEVTDGWSGIRGGDTVVVEVDGGVTVKTFYRDGDGSVWLLPHNENYNPIQLTPEMDVVVFGKVVAIVHDTPRIPLHEIMKIMERAKKQDEEAPSDRAIRNVILKFAGQITVARLWFSVFRSLADAGAFTNDGIGAFVDLVASLVPDHGHLPSVVEMRRMCLCSFAKPLAKWDRYNAPVSGARFSEYYRIALEVREMLE